MLAFKAIALFGIFGCALAADCISGMGKRCLTKSEAGPYSIFMTGGDHCFAYMNSYVSPLCHDRKLCYSMQDLFTTKSE